MEFFSSNIKKFLYSVKRKLSYILSKESISYISENRTLHFSAQALKRKEIHPGKIYYTLGSFRP